MISTVEDKLNCITKCHLEYIHGLHAGVSITLLVVCLAAFAAIVGVPIIYKHFRQIFRPLVTARVEVELQTILKLQWIHHPLLDAANNAVAFATSVEFYTSFLPALIWLGERQYGRSTVLVLALCTYVGNCMKDMICGPRPSSPPVRRPNAMRDHNEEYGLPSTHAINTIVFIGFTVYYYGLHGVLSRQQMSWIIPVCILWSAIVVYSRIYLGMHSPVDIVTGIMVAIVFLILWCPVSEYFDYFFMHSDAVVVYPVMAAFYFLLTFAYPTPMRPTPSYEYNLAFLNSASGSYFGARQLIVINGGSYLYIRSIRSIFIRLVVGMPVAYAARTVVKYAAKFILPRLCQVLNFPAYDLEALAKNRDLESQADDVVTMSPENPNCEVFTQADQRVFNICSAIRACSYFAVGWYCNEYAFYLFQLLGI